MKDRWWMITLIGRDAPGIVAALTRMLADGGCNLGETSMLRLGVQRHDDDGGGCRSA